MPDEDPMAQLYSRLGSVGFPPKYLREVVLPEWWEDEVAHNPAWTVKDDGSIAL